ncbi:MAG: SixA phosphatase family protein [Verrucomicrobiales bacterium]
MKLLTVVRHAKSSWGDDSLPDHDRPLNNRGLRVAPLMGEVLASRIELPDLVLSSTALRARTTAGIIASKLGYADQEIVEDGQIYHASTAELLKVLREIDESHRSAIVFGHVPGVHQLSNTLCPDAGIQHFPTCAASLIELDIDYWGEIGENCGKLVDFLVPKQLLPEA